VAALTPARPAGHRSVPRPTTGLRRREAPDVTSRPFTRRALLHARSQALHDGGRVADVVATVDAELARALADGSIAPDPQRASSVVALRGRSGGRIPAGVVEPVLVTREFLQLESGLSEALAAADELGRGPLAPGLYAARDTGGEPFDVAVRLSSAVAWAVAEGRPVVGAAPGVRRAAHLEAVIGAEVTDRPRSSVGQRGALVVVGDADQWHLATLAGLLDAAAGMSATVLLAPSAAGSGRSALVEALRRDPVTADRAGGGPVDRAADGSRQQAGALAVRLVREAGGLVDAVLGESDRQRSEVGGSLVVVADRALAASVERAGDGRVRVAGAAELGSALRAAPGTGVVVLGSARLLGRCLEVAPDLPRTHVGLAPPGADAAGEARWAAHLASGRPGVGLGAGHSRGRDEVDRAGRGVRGRATGLGIEIGR
jgi:hypothetical protein